MSKHELYVADPLSNDQAMESPGRASRADGGREPPSPTARTAAASPMVSPGRGPGSMLQTALPPDTQRSQTASHHTQRSSRRDGPNITNSDSTSQLKQQEQRNYDEERGTSGKSNASHHGEKGHQSKSYRSGERTHRTGNRLLEKHEDDVAAARQKGNPRALDALVSQNELLERLKSDKSEEHEEELKKLQQRIAQESAVSGLRGYGVEGATSMKHYHRQRLIDFYLVYNPAQLSAVEQLLEEFEGREYRFFSGLEYKYGPEPSKLPPAVCSRLYYLTHSKDFDPEEFRKMIKDRPFEPLFGQIIIALAYDAVLSGELKTIEAKQLEMDLINQMDMQEQAYERQVNRNSRRTTIQAERELRRKSHTTKANETTGKGAPEPRDAEEDEDGGIQLPQPYAGRLGSVEPNRMGLSEMMLMKRTELLSSATSLLTDTDALKYISAATREMTTKPLPDHLNAFASPEEEAYNRMYYADLRTRLHQYLSTVNPKAMVHLDRMVDLVKKHRYRESELWQELYSLYGTGAKETCEPRRSMTPRSSSAAMAVTTPRISSQLNTPRRRPWEHSAVFTTYPRGDADETMDAEDRPNAERDYEKKMEYARKEHARRHASALQAQRWHMLIRMKLNDIQQITPIMQFAEVDPSEVENSTNRSLLTNGNVADDSGLLNTQYILMLPDSSASYLTPMRNDIDTSNVGAPNMDASVGSTSGASFSGLRSATDADFVQHDANNSSAIRHSISRSNRSINDAPSPISEWSTFNDLCNASKQLEDEQRKKQAEKRRDSGKPDESRRRASRSDKKDKHAFRLSSTQQVQPKEAHLSNVGDEGVAGDDYRIMRGDANPPNSFEYNDNIGTARPGEAPATHGSNVDSSIPDSYRSTKLLPNRVSVDERRNTIAYTYPDSMVDPEAQHRKLVNQSVKHVDFMQRVPTRMHSREFEQYMSMYTSSSSPQEPMQRSQPQKETTQSPRDQPAEHRTRSNVRTPTVSSVAGGSRGGGGPSTGRKSPSSRHTPQNTNHHHSSQATRDTPLVEFSARGITPTMRSVSASTGVSALTTTSRMRGYGGPAGVGAAQQYSPNPTSRPDHTPTDRTMRYEDLFGLSEPSETGQRTSPSTKTVSTATAGTRITKIGVRPSRKSEEKA